MATKPEILSPGTGRRILDAVQWVEQQRRPMTGPSTSPERGSDISFAVRNQDSEEAPQFGCAWLIDRYDSAHSREVVIRRPEYGGVSRIGIICGAMPAAGSGRMPIGRVWTDGIHPLLVDDLASITAGDRVGAKPDSWYATRDELGPFLVLGVLTGSWAVVAITHQRGDCIYTRTPHGDVRLPAQTWWLRKPLKLTEIAPGRARIDRET